MEEVVHTNQMPWGNLSPNNPQNLVEIKVNDTFETYPTLAHMQYAFILAPNNPERRLNIKDRDLKTAYDYLTNILNIEYLKALYIARGERNGNYKKNASINAFKNYLTNGEPEVSMQTYGEILLNRKLSDNELQTMERTKYYQQMVYLRTLYVKERASALMCR